MYCQDVPPKAYSVSIWMMSVEWLVCPAMLCVDRLLCLDLGGNDVVLNVNIEIQSATAKYTTFRIGPLNKLIKGDFSHVSNLLYMKCVNKQKV